jgi:ribosomal protein S27E
MSRSPLRPDLRCQVCGSTALQFNPAKNALECQHCGNLQEIETSRQDVVELDFEQALLQRADIPKKEVAVVKCPSCYAQVTMPQNLTSDECPFCGTVLVVQNGTLCEIISPKSLLPFKIDKKNAQDLYKNWLKSLWFAPNDLTKRASLSEKLKGMYVPYWTYDSQTHSRYTGQRGDNYTVSETYQDENGNTQTRQVTKTRWTSVSGSVDYDFDDICVAATHTLPRRYVDALEPWDTKSLVDFDERFLAGFQTETYQIGLKEGFELAKNQMQALISERVKAQIGGDLQRIETLETQYENTTFKHVLMPIWISAYRYQEKPFRFLVNARTGEVQGERPYSWIKICSAILAVLTAIGAIYYFYG